MKISIDGQRDWLALLKYRAVSFEELNHEQATVVANVRYEKRKTILLVIILFKVGVAIQKLGLWIMKKRVKPLLDYENHAINKYDYWS